MKFLQRMFKPRWILTPLRTSRVSIPLPCVPLGPADYYFATRVYVFGILVAEIHERMVRV